MSKLVDLKSHGEAAAGVAEDVGVKFYEGLEETRPSAERRARRGVQILITRGQVFVRLLGSRGFYPVSAMPDGTLSRRTTSRAQDSPV